MSDNGHIRQVCSPEHDEMQGCMICNLYLCKVCGGFEGTLPTQCPGAKILEEHQQLIYNSTLDFRDDRWIRRPYERHETPNVGAEIVVDCVALRLNEERACDASSASSTASS